MLEVIATSDRFPKLAALVCQVANLSTQLSLLNLSVVAISTIFSELSLFLAFSSFSLFE